MLVLLPELEAFAGGCCFFWSLFFPCELFTRAGFELLFERCSCQELEEVELFWEVDWLLVERLLRLISDWRSQ